ncbi:hypothetical protein BDF19DRAFT_273875 [Syncephalis fuscata]|nr:hypothetical protein BDF19DRAFT_273875 [Syncephalis fuscata]
MYHESRASIGDGTGCSTSPQGKCCCMDTHPTPCNNLFPRHFMTDHVTGQLKPKELPDPLGIGEENHEMGSQHDEARRIDEAGAALAHAATIFAQEADRLKKIWPVELQHWVEDANTRPHPSTIAGLNEAVIQVQMHLDAVNKRFATRRQIRDTHASIAATLANTATEHKMPVLADQAARWQFLETTRGRLETALIQLERWQTTLHATLL